MRRLAPVLLLVLTLAAYHNARDGGLVLDDLATLPDNPSIHQLWPLGPALAPPPDTPVGGRPLANLTFAVGYALGGADVRVHHAINLALHAASALVLFGLVRRTLLRPALRARCGADATAIAFAAAALWAVHPLTTNVVDYIAQRTEALMALCYLGTLYAFVRAAEQEETNDARRARRWQFVAVLVCAAGMACKEVMVTAPLVVLLYDRTFVAGTWRDALRRHRGTHAALAATWLVLAGLMLTSSLAERGVGFAQAVSPWTYFLTASTALTRYLRLAVWPSPLVFDYGWRFVPHVAAALPHLAACALLIAATLVALVRRPPVGFVGAAVLLVLAPTTSFIPIAQQPIAESRMYLPLAALVAGGVVTAHVFFQRRAFYFAAAAIAVALGATAARNRDYRTALALWTDTIAKAPDNARAYGNRGAELANLNRFAEADADFATALRLRPDYAEAHNNLAASLVRAGRAAEALPHLDLALRQNPAAIRPLYNRANALAQLGRRPEALAAYARVLEIDPRHVRAHSDLGVICLETGDVTRALGHATTAAQLDPGFAPAHHNLGNALAAAGRLPEAIARYRAALQLDPQAAKTEHNLAVALLRTGDPRGAIEHFAAALRLQPDYPEARKNLEIVRAQQR